MVEPLLQRVSPDPRERGEGPSFITVVVLSGIVLVLFFIGAYLVLRTTVSDLVPGAAPPHNPNAVLRLEEPPSRAV